MATDSVALPFDVELRELLTALRTNLKCDKASLSNLHMEDVNEPPLETRSPTAQSPFFGKYKDGVPS